MAKMSDVAKRAGVTLSTVSHTLSGKRPVAEETRLRVQQAIAELNYHPNLLARGLANRRSQILALLFPSHAKGLSVMQLEFVTSAADVASQRDYGLLLWSSPTDDEGILRLVRQGLVDGLILMEVRLRDSRVKLLKELEVPFSMIGRCQNNAGLYFVDLDFESAFGAATEYLADLGHRNVAFINLDAALVELGLAPAKWSLKGFQSAARQRGLNGIVRTGGPRPQDGYVAVQNLLKEHPQVSAVVTLNEEAVGGMIAAIQDAGLRIPDDFSIVVASSARYAEMFNPALTAIEYPIADMARIGVENLIAQLEGTSAQPSQQLLKASLTVRRSSGTYKKK